MQQNMTKKRIENRQIRLLVHCGLVMAIVMVMLSFANHGLQDGKTQDEEYELVFFDEFNLPNGSQPDSSKWKRCSRNPSRWARWISDSKEVVYIKHGRLVCRAIPNKNLKTDTATMLTGAVETMGLTPIDWRSRLTAKHIFTHVEWHMTGYALTVRGSGPAELEWVDQAGLAERSVPSAFARYYEEANDILKEN